MDNPSREWLIQAGAEQDPQGLIVGATTRRLRLSPARSERAPSTLRARNYHSPHFRSQRRMNRKIPESERGPGPTTLFG